MSGQLFNGGMHFKEYLGSPADFTVLPWEKGFPGKGILLHGNLYVWRTANGDPDPHHDGMYEYAMMHDVDQGYYAAPKINISPDGTIEHLRMGTGKGQGFKPMRDADIEQQIAQFSPDFKLQEDTEAWEFGVVANTGHPYTWRDAGKLLQAEPWEPGFPGKAWVDESGNVVAWKTSGRGMVGVPHHNQMTRHPHLATYYDVYPDGTFVLAYDHNPRAAFNPSERLAEFHPALKPAGAEGEWHFGAWQDGKVAGKPDPRLPVPPEPTDRRDQLWKAVSTTDGQHHVFFGSEGSGGESHIGYMMRNGISPEQVYGYWAWNPYTEGWEDLSRFQKDYEGIYDEVQNLPAEGWNFGRPTLSRKRVNKAANPVGEQDPAEQLAKRIQGGVGIDDQGPGGDTQSGNKRKHNHKHSVANPDDPYYDPEFAQDEGDEEWVDRMGDEMAADAARKPGDAEITHLLDEGVKPGERGKGLRTPDGQEFFWRTEGEFGWPHHDDVARYLGLYNAPDLHYLIVDEDGTVTDALDFQDDSAWTIPV